MEALEKLIETMPQKEADVMRLLVDALQNAEQGFKHCSNEWTQKNYNMVRKTLQEANKIAGEV